MFVLGIDSSTQSTKALVIDADSGRVVGQGQAGHPPGTEAPPSAWWSACEQAVHQACEHAPGPVEAVAVAGQQHGMVALDAAGSPVRDALLWNDTRSAPQAQALVDRHGAHSLAERTGSVPLSSFTLTKLAWLAEHEPHHADRVEQVLLPHDWLSLRLAEPGTPPRTDRGDASGTGYFSPTTGDWIPELVSEAMGGRQPHLPEVLGPDRPAGTVSGIGVLDGAVLAPGTGDNMAAALGLGIRPGDVVVSVGTSGTAFTVAEQGSADATGTVAGFCDATGRHLPLVCTLNAVRVLEAGANMLGTDLDGLSALAMSASPGAAGLTLVPYLDGERTPNLPDAAGSLTGMRTTNLIPENIARAAVEGMLCGLADGVDAIRRSGAAVERILLIGGGSRSEAVRRIAPSVFGVDVEVPESGEYVARGAARQAAWVASTNDSPPDWPLHTERYEASDTGQGSAVRHAYHQARHTVYGL